MTAQDTTLTDTPPEVVRKKRTSKKAKPEITEEQIAEMKAQLREELLQEFKSEMSKKDAIEDKRRKEEQKLLENVIVGVKESPDPWVIVAGHGPTNEEGLKMEIEWNPSFINFLREQGLTGSDDDQLVNNWLILFLHQIVELDTDETAESHYE